MTETAVPEKRRGVRRGVYVLPALFTVGNLLCGFLAVEASVRSQWTGAAMLVFLAALLDGLDGRVARLTGSTSAFGEQLDSLADVISFGLAPAYLVHRWALSDLDRAGLFASFLFLTCGACRLARFNVQVGTVDKRYFVGLPIPAAACALAGLIWVVDEPPAGPWGWVFFAITAILSYLMVSTIRYRSFKDLDLKFRRTRLLVPLLAASVAGFVILKELALTVVLVAYAVSGPAARVYTALLPRKGAREAS